MVVRSKGVWGLLEPLKSSGTFLYLLPMRSTDTSAGIARNKADVTQMPLLGP